MLIEEIDDLIEDDAFWDYQARGLLMHATPDNLRTFRVPSMLQPLILAAVEALAAIIYRSVNSYPHLADQGLRGNPERQSAAELASAARDVLDNLYRERIARWHERYRRRLNEDRGTTDLARSARAATAPAVASLLVYMDQVVNGTVNEADGTVTFAESAGADSYEVADEVARRVLLTGGEVLSVRAEDMPEPGMKMTTEN